MEAAKALLATADAISMTIEFLTGTGMEERAFGEGTPQGDQLRHEPDVQQGWAAYLSKNELAIRGEAEFAALTNWKLSFGLRGLIRSGVNVTRQFVGSARLDIYPVDDRSAMLVITNTTSFTSLMYNNPVLSAPSWSRDTFAPMGNMTQLYIWTEEIPY